MFVVSEHIPQRPGQAKDRNYHSCSMYVMAPTALYRVSYRDKMTIQKPLFPYRKERAVIRTFAYLSNLSE
jgi:hypothetical protein